MITLVAETSFKDKGGIYRKFNIQTLYLQNRTYSMLVINLDGYDEFSCGLTYESFKDNSILIFKHIDTMFGLTNLDDFQSILIEKNIAYRRRVTFGDAYYGKFLRMQDGDFKKEYKMFLEK